MCLFTQELDNFAKNWWKARRNSNLIKPVETQGSRKFELTVFFRTDSRRRIVVNHSCTNQSTNRMPGCYTEQRVHEREWPVPGKTVSSVPQEGTLQVLQFGVTIWATRQRCETIVILGLRCSQHSWQNIFNGRSSTEVTQNQRKRQTWLNFLLVYSSQMPKNILSPPNRYCSNMYTHIMDSFTTQPIAYPMFSSALYLKVSCHLHLLVARNGWTLSHFRATVC